MKRTLHTILLLLVAGVTFAQSYPRKCYEEEIPTSARGDYYKTVELYLNIYYQMLPISIGSAENREAIIDKVMANKQGTTLKTEFLLNPEKNLSFVSPSQYYVKFEKEFGQMADEVEFVVDNYKHGDIMMSSLTSCFIPVDYDLTAKKGDEVLFKRRCRMTFLFQKVAISSFAQTMQVEPIRDIIAYVPKSESFKQMYEQAEKWLEQGLADKYLPVYKQLAEQGYTDAQWRYGWCLADENLKQYNEAVMWLQKAVDKNHPKAFNSLGWCYREGIGVEKNLQKAFELFKLSAEAGFHTGAYNLAAAYEKGEGCQQSFIDADKWYTKAAELGNKYAYENCVYMYWSNDSKKVREFILKGIENEDIGCYALLGGCYKFGYHDFPIDYDKAAEHYKVVMDFRAQDNKKMYDDEWYDFYDKQYQQVKPWYDRKPGNLFVRLKKDSSNPYIAKVRTYQPKKKNDDKYNKAIQKRHSHPDASVKELTKLAEAGMPDALTYMGNYWYQREQYDKAYNMYAASAMYLHKNSTDALNGLADCYYYGKHVPVDYTQAVRLYEMAAEEDHRKTRFELGYSYYAGNGVGLSWKKAFPYLLDAAKGGSMDAAAYLGICYANEYGTKKDTIQAAEWLKKAAVKGIPMGMYGWGVYLYNGITVQKDIPLAINFLTNAAKGGVVPSMKMLGGHYYIKGQSAEALKWYEMAAEKGSAEAQYWTGELYLNKKGEGNYQSIAKMWLEKSAKQGYGDGMGKLAWILYNENTPDSRKQAFEWWFKAAKAGNVISQYNLALCYENAWGVDKSKANALEWYIEASKGKDESSIQKVKNLKKQYKPKSVPAAVKNGQFSGTAYYDNKPLSDVFIYVPDTDIITMTDSEGRFFLNGVKEPNKVFVLHPEKGLINYSTIKLKEYGGFVYTLTLVDNIRKTSIDFESL